MATLGFVERATGAVTPFVADPSQTEVLALGASDSAAVIGAPGSGKTATLIELIASRVSAGLSPDAILVLTPQRRAATRLRDQIAERLGVTTQGAMARTPSSLAFALAREHALITGSPEPTLLTGSEQDAIMADLLAGHVDDNRGPAWPDPLVPEVRERLAFRAELRDLLGRAMELGLTPATLAAAGGKAHPEWAAAAEFWNEYTEVLSHYRQTSYDSSELLALAATALANPEVMPQVKLVLVDDAGEITAGAVRILKAFAARGVPVIAFGDPDTATTTFRGALPQFLGRFAAEVGLPGAKQLVLQQVHRHGPAIRTLVSAFTRMGAAEAGTQRQATSRIDDAVVSPLISVLQRNSATAEATAIARLLRERHVRDGLPFDRMAVVVRNGAQVPRIARALAVAEVPTRTLVSERTIRDHPAALDLLTVLEIALGLKPLDQVRMTQLLLSPLVEDSGLSVLELRRVRQALRHQELTDNGVRTGEELLLEAMSSPGDLLTLGFKPATRAGHFAQMLQQLTHDAEAGASVEELLWTVWEHSGLAKAWGEEALGSGLVADDANRNLDGVMALFTSAKRYVERNPSDSPRAFVEQMLSADVPEDTLAPAGQKDSVLVTTPTSLIGAEFDVVVVAAVQENVWPNLRPRGSLLHAQELGGASVAVSLPAEAQRAAERQQVLDDELRMFTLALSRARQQVILTASISDDTLPSPFVRRAENLATDVIETNDDGLDLREHPMTLRGLVGSLRRALTQSLRGSGDGGRRGELAAAIAKLQHAEVPGAAPAQWYGLRDWSTDKPLHDLTDPEDTVSVSPSKLETWEKNQLVWFIDSVVGRTSGIAQGVGTIVHSVVELAGKNPSLPIDAASLLAVVNERWHELAFEAEWLSEVEQRRVAKMTAAASQYLTEFRDDGNELIAAEGGFTLEIGPARVRGYIDRVEKSSDERVVIVDLKTGKYPPALKDMPEHAQLACYQLALDGGVIKAADGSTLEGEINGGGKLIYLTDGKVGQLYKALPQEPFTDEKFTEWREKIEKAAVGMAGTVFTAKVEIKSDDFDPHNRYEYRIHTVPAVSSS